MIQQPSKKGKRMETPTFVNDELFGNIINKVPSKPQKPSKKAKRGAPNLLPNLIDGDFLGIKDKEPVEVQSKKAKMEAPNLLPNLIDGDFLDMIDKEQEPVEVPNLLPNLIDGDFLDMIDKEEQPIEVPNLLPNLIDGEFLGIKDKVEVDKEEVEQVQQNMKKKKPSSKKVKFPESFVPETKDKTSQTTDDEKSFICPDCEAEFNRKFKRNRHVYVAHKKMSDQLEEIIKTAEKHGRDLADNAVNHCCCPIIVICIE